MIAVAKGLLGGLETAVGSTTKKDGTGAPFADTFQQASTNQATAIVTNRATSGNGAAPSKRASGSSVADPAKQATSVSVGGSTSVVKDDANETPGLVAGPTGHTADKNDAAVFPIAKDDVEAVDGTVGQVDAGGGKEPGQAATVTTQPPTGAGAAQRVRVDRSNVADLASVSQRKGNVLPLVEAGTGDSGKAVARAGESRETDGSSSVAAPIAPVVSEGIYVAGSTPLISSPLLQQTSPEELKVTGDAPEFAGVSVTTRQRIIDLPVGRKQGSDPQAALAPQAGDLASLSKTEARAASLAESTELQVPAQTSALRIPALVQTENLVPATALGVKLNTAPAVVGSRFTKGEADGSAALAGGASVQKASVYPQTTAPSQTLQTADSDSSLRIVSEAVASSSDLNGSPSVVPQLQVRAKESLAAVASGSGAPVEGVAEKPETGIHKDSSGTAVTRTSKDGEAKQVKASAANTLEETATATSAVVLDTAAAALAVPTLYAAVAVPSVAEHVAPTVTVPTRGVVSSSASVVPSARNGAVERVASGSNSTVLTTGATTSVTSVVSDPATSLKAAKMGGVQGGVQAAVLEKIESVESRADESGPVVSAQAATSPAANPVATGGSLSGEAVVAAANTLVRNGQQHGISESGTPIAKERKETVAKAGTASVPSASAETGAAATVADSSVATLHSKMASGEHAVVANGSPALPGAAVANMESAGLAGQSQAAAVAASIAPTVVQGIPSSVSGGTVAGAHVEGAASQTGLQNADPGLSPLAHTTLSATPTVLEVGVPRGTQGWLKIRAEIGEGGFVQASMSASTHAGQDALHRDLPAMSAFLENEHVPVTLQVTHATSAGVASLTGGDGLLKEGGFNLGSSLGQSLNQNAGSSAGSGQSETNSATSAGDGGSGQRGEPQREGSVPSSGVVDEPSPVTQPGLGADWATPTGYGRGSVTGAGNWLNVMA